MSTEPTTFPRNAGAPWLSLWSNRQRHKSLELPPDWFHFDDEYLEKLRRRDSETIKHFVQYFSPRIRIKLRSSFQCREDIEDISQEVFSRVLKAVDGNAIQDGRKLAAYVVGVCHRASLEAIKKKKHRLPADHIVNASHPDASIEDKLICEERRQRIRAVLDEMSEKDRNLLIRLIMQDEDRQTLSDEFGYSRGQLRVLLFRALQRFRKKIRNADAAQ